VTTPGVRPLTEIDLAQPGPGVLSASRLYVDEALTWLARVSLPGSFLLPIAARRMDSRDVDWFPAESGALIG
jgi:hypothetical protein